MLFPEIEQILRSMLKYKPTDRPKIWEAKDMFIQVLNELMLKEPRIEEGIWQITLFNLKEFITHLNLVLKIFLINL